MRTALERTGWAVLSIDHVAGRHEPWLYVLARAGEPRTQAAVNAD